VKRLFCILLAMLASQSMSFAQTSLVAADAAKNIQQAQSATTGSPQDVVKPVEPAGSESPVREPVAIKIPAGTQIEVEAAYTVRSIDLKPGDLLSFRVLVPIVIDGLTVIERDALVTARVTLAKRGGHWGRAGKLAWTMEDVVAADNTRIRLAPETRIRNDTMWSLETKGKNSGKTLDQGRVTGTSHGAEVATKTIVTAAIIPFLAPLALMQGFRRGENAVLPEGKRFVVLVRADSDVKAAPVNR
jgi:hypothetical protein